jgi:hypothetical protein
MIPAWGKIGLLEDLAIHKKTGETSHEKMDFRSDRFCPARRGFFVEYKCSRRPKCC